MRNAAHVEHDLHLELQHKQVLAQDVVLLTLARPDGGDLPAWDPGAHIDLVLTDDLTRQYSLCGDPADRSVYRVAVLREASGRGGSQHVHDVLTEGQTLEVQGPRNHFRLEPAERYLFIAGGIGITPLLPMLAAAEGAGAEWTLLYGGRSRATMAYAADLEEIHGNKVTVHPQDEAGLLDLQTALAAPSPGAVETAVYCCGPEALLSAVELQCSSWPAGALHVERFAPKPVLEDGTAVAQFEVELAKTGHVLTVPPDRSILDVVEDAGVPILSSCGEGTCGTCESTVLAGTPDHRDSVLTDEEQAEGTVMMICVSRSRSPRLVLDL